MRRYGGRAKTKHRDETDVEERTRCSRNDVVRVLLAREYWLQLRTGQWECALLHARYTLDRTGYGQTADIWS